MNLTTQRILIWTPRVIGVTYTLFISMFALDALGHGHGFWKTALDLLKHLIPSFLLLAMVVLAWRWQWIGTVISSAMLGLFLWWNFNFRHNVPSAVLVIAGPLALMAVLYLVSWLKRAELRMVR